MFKTNVDILNGKIFKNLFIYTLPIILTGVLQLLYNAADVIVVGRYAGSGSLAAVGATSSITNLLTNLFIGLSAGSSVCVAQFIGAKQHEDIKDSVHTSITISAIGGLFLLFLGVFLAKPLLLLMDTPADIIDEAALYMRIIFLGMPFMMVYNFSAAILRASGDTKTPLVFLSISGILNVILNLIFVIIFNRGADGVGLATIISQLLSVILILRHLMKLDTDIKLLPSELKIHKKIFARILRIGIPSGIQGSLFSISNVLIQSSINSFGSIAVAGNSAAGNIEGFTYIAMNATYQALLTFIGQNLGAKNYDRLKKILGIGCLQVTLVGVSFSAICLIFSHPLLSLYAPDSPDVINAGITRLNIVLSTYFLCGFMEAVVGTIRGLGSSVPTMIVSIFGVCGIRIAWIYTIFAHYKTLTSLYISYPVSWFITTSIHFIYCFWLLNKITKTKKTI